MGIKYRRVPEAGRYTQSIRIVSVGRFCPDNRNPGLPDRAFEISGPMVSGFLRKRESKRRVLEHGQNRVPGARISILVDRFQRDRSGLLFFDFLGLEQDFGVGPHRYRQVGAGNNIFAGDIVDFQ